MYEYPCEVLVYPDDLFNGFLALTIGAPLNSSYFDHWDIVDYGIGVAPLGWCIRDDQGGFHYEEHCINTTHGYYALYGNTLGNGGVDGCDPSTYLGVNVPTTGNYPSCGKRKCVSTDYVKVDVFQPNTTDCVDDTDPTKPYVYRNSLIDFGDPSVFCPVPDANGDMKIRCGDLYDGLLSQACGKNDNYVMNYKTSERGVDDNCLDLSPCLCRPEQEMKVYYNCYQSCHYTGDTLQGLTPGNAAHDIMIEELNDWCDNVCRSTENDDRDRCHNECECTRENPPAPAPNAPVCEAISPALSDDWCKTVCTDFKNAGGVPSDYMCNPHWKLCDCITW